VPEEETSGSNLVTIEESSGSNEYTDPPKVALTFDDGPSSTCTGRLLDGLKERGVKATFFLIGENAEANPELVERINAEGHLIGNHTYHHVQITSLSDAEAIKEVKETDEVVYSITGKHVEYMRPPFGDWKKDLEYEMEVLPVLWTIDPLDWTTNNVDEIVNKVVTEVSENDIILLHDCYDSSVDAALRIVDYLQTEGYDLVTVDKLMLE
jgi:peptidoglycan/xylan/chitin deacetylase (PgdA/CDA1 family)